MKRKTITFLLIGMLIGIILGSFLSREIKAVGYDEVYYLKKIYSSLSSIESYLSSIESDVSSIESDVDDILRYVRYGY